MKSTSNKRRKHPCPCGKDYYTIINYGDKEGFFQEHWEMSCKRCRKTHLLGNFVKETAKGPAEEYLWVPVSINAKLTRLEEQIEKNQNEALTLAHELYLEKWLLYCCSCKNKKQIWDRLTARGKVEPSFDLFNQVTCCQNMAEYLSNYFNYQNIDHILKILGTCSPQIKALKNKNTMLKNELDRMKGRAWLQGIRQGGKHTELPLNGKTH